MAPRDLQPATTPAARDAATFLASLGKAARAFVLYDGGNVLIRRFLADYRESARRALAGPGPLHLEVHPLEIALGTELVYAERDQERSLAHRLFRDGVRRLSFDPSASWEELLRFLEVLSIRYSGVRQQEEDFVTLLRKAELTGISALAVEGFAPEEATRRSLAGLRRVVELGIPADWDQPTPRLPQPAPLAYRPIAPEALAAMRAEEEPAALPRSALGAVRTLIAEASRAGADFPIDELSSFVSEVQDFLLSEGQLEPLLQLATLVSQLEPDGALRAEVERGLGDSRALGLLLGAVPSGATELPGDLAPLLPFLRLGPALDLLEQDQPPPRRRLLLALATARLPDEAELLLQRLPGLEEALAVELFRALCARAPDRAGGWALGLLRQASAALRVEALRALESAPGEQPVAPLLPLIDDAEEGIRIQVATLLGRRRVVAAFEPLAAALERRKEISPAEAEAVGRALALLAPLPASQRFSIWIEPRRGGLLKLLAPSQHQRSLQWAAVAGMGLLPGPEPQARLEALAAGSEEELRRHCRLVLARRRREGSQHG